VVRRVLEEVAKVAEVAVVKEGGRDCVKIRSPDKSKVEKTVAILKAVGIKGGDTETRSKDTRKRAIEKIRRSYRIIIK